MPHSVEMPAPVNGTTDVGARDQFAQRGDAGLQIGRDHPGPLAVEFLPVNEY